MTAKALWSRPLTDPATSPRSQGPDHEHTPTPLRFSLLGCGDPALWLRLQGIISTVHDEVKAPTSSEPA